MRIGLAMARRVSALVTVTAASSGSCPSLEFVSFIVEDSFSVASHYIQIFCTKYLLLNGFATCVSPVTPRSIAAAKNVYSGTRNKPRGNLYAHDCQ